MYFVLYETHLPTQKAKQTKSSWLSQTHGDNGRPSHLETSPRPWPQRTLGIIAFNIPKG